MKKVATGILSVLLVVAVALFGTCAYFLVRSCSFVGVYKFESMKIETGNEVNTVKVGKEYEGVIISEDYVTLTVNEDNTYELKMVVLEAEETLTGSWKKEGGKYYLDSNGAESVATVTFWKVTFKNNGTTLVLTK